MTHHTFMLLRSALIRRTGFAGSRNDFCGAEFTLRETKIISLRFLRSETPQSFSKKRSLFPLRFSQKRNGKFD